MSNKTKIILGVIAVVIVALAVFKIINNSKVAGWQRSNIMVVKIQKPVIQTLTEKLEYKRNIAAIQQANIFFKSYG